MLELSGFGWDDEKKLVTAPDEVWELYVKAHKNAARFRKTPFPQYQKMHELCSEVVATGVTAFNAENSPEAERARSPSWKSSNGSKTSRSSSASSGASEKPKRKKQRSGHSSLTAFQTHQETGTTAGSLSTPSRLSATVAATGPGPPKRKRATNTGALVDVKDSLEGLKEVAVMDIQIQEQNRAKDANESDPLSAAIALVEADEELNDEQKADAIDVFVRDVNMARAFMAIVTLLFVQYGSVVASVSVLRLSSSLVLAIVVIISVTRLP